MLSGKITLLSVCSLGGIGFVPFFASSGWGGQSSKGKGWTIKNGGNEIASVYFTSDSPEAPNQNLRGGWALLNQKKSNEADMFGGGGFDVAIPSNNLFSSNEKPNMSNMSDKRARVLYCNRDQGEKMVTAKTSNKHKVLYCKDLSGSWYLGRIKGNHYSAVFAVIKEGILKKDSSKNIGELQKLTQEDSGEFHERLTEILKLATRPRKIITTFDAEALMINTRTLTYADAKYTQDWCSQKMCFLWGTIYDVGIKNESNDNCTPKDSFTGCEIEIVDFSKYDTLKSFIPFWDFSNRLSVVESL